MPGCHPECPQDLGSVIRLAESWRSVSFVTTNGNIFSSVDQHTASTAAASPWYRFALPAGSAMPITPPRARRCGNEVGGWLQSGDGHHGPAFVFRRPTRGLDANGHAFGSKASREARANAHAPSQLRAEGAEHGGKRQNVGGAER